MFLFFFPILIIEWILNGFFLTTDLHILVSSRRQALTARYVIYSMSKGRLWLTHSEYYCEEQKNSDDTISQKR